MRPEPKHGTRSRYVKRGCRCDRCKKANRAYYNGRTAMIQRLRIVKPLLWEALSSVQALALVARTPEARADALALAGRIALALPKEPARRIK